VRAVFLTAARFEGRAIDIVLVEAEPYVSLIELRVRAAASGVFATPPAVMTARTLNLSEGSLDRERIDDLLAAARRRDDLLLFESPADACEATIARHVEELLSLKPVGATDDFFMIGLDSLAAIQLALFIDEKWPGRIDSRTVLESGTVRALAQAIIAAAPAFAPETAGEPETALADTTRSA
jgi:acyl carrier protein